jgi:hypothetical protein
VFLTIVYYYLSFSKPSSFRLREAIFFYRALISGVYHGFKYTILIEHSILASATLIIASIKARARASF